VEALAGVRELPPKRRVRLVGARARPSQERILAGCGGAERGRARALPEADRSRQRAVIEEIPENFGPRREAVVASMSER
jgi:hypothetical protein